MKARSQHELLHSSTSCSGNCIKRLACVASAEKWGGVMKFEFAKYTEVTELAFKANREYQANGYERIFLCCDTKVFWIARILKGYGEDYEELEGSYIVERDKKDKWDKTEKLNTPKAKKLLANDELENWDYEVYDCLEGAIDSLDDGFGINNLSEVN